MAKYLILKKRRDFLKAAKDVTFITPNVIVQAAFCSDKDKSGWPRIGFTATKKIGKAYYRNRSKRRLRAVAREINRRRVMRNVDYVFVARRDTGTCDYSKLKDSLIWALQRTNAILLRKQKENEQNSDCSD